jgi:hypothetical protein
VTVGRSRFTVDQRLFNLDAYDDVLRVWFTTLGTITISSPTTVHVRLGERTDGYVVAGPMRFVNVGDPDDVTRVYRNVDLETGEPFESGDLGYNGFDVHEVGRPSTDMSSAIPEVRPRSTPGSRSYDVGWHETAYEASSGNFPLWEADPAAGLPLIFRDWQNSPCATTLPADPCSFPALGDATRSTRTTAATRPRRRDGRYITPFDPQPSLPVARPGPPSRS